MKGELWFLMMLSSQRRQIEKRRREDWNSCRIAQY